MMAVMANTRTFRRTERHPGCDNFGPLDLVITEQVTETAHGVVVETRTRGTQEGRKIDQRGIFEAGGVEFERACNYRLRMGFDEIGARP